MKKDNLIAEFIIPEYLREIQVSNKQRPKYYTFENSNIKAKGKKLLQKYINPEFKNSIIVNNNNTLPICLKYPYFIVGIIKCGKVIGIYGHKSVKGKYITSNHFNRFNIKLTEKQGKSKMEYILINIETKEKVIANSTQAGKPKRIIIKGQDMYSGVLNEFTRAKIVNELKADYKNKIHYLIEPAKIEIWGKYFPIKIELEIIDTIRNHYDRTKEGNGIRWDVGNRAMPYMKTFVDFLVDNDVLPDDDRLHVSGESYYFTPCEKHEDRKLIFRIYKV